MISVFQKRYDFGQNNFLPVNNLISVFWMMRVFASVYAANIKMDQFSGKGRIFQILMAFFESITSQFTYELILIYIEFYVDSLKLVQYEGKNICLPFPGMIVAFIFVNKEFFDQNKYDY